MTTSSVIGEEQCFRGKSSLLLQGKYSKTCLKRTPYIPEIWTNGK
jgi:hypothetical protein